MSRLWDMGLRAKARTAFPQRKKKCNQNKNKSTSSHRNQLFLANQRHLTQPVIDRRHPRLRSL
jgi:hypothetical protein